MNVKRLTVLAIVLVAGIALGALLFGPANNAQGQEIVPRFAFRFPPSPCRLEVQSRIISAPDGTATAHLVAFPPSPCSEPLFGVIFNTESEPADTATCERYGTFEGAGVLTCEFTAEHEHTTFSVQPIGRRGVLE